MSKNIFLAFVLVFLLMFSLCFLFAIGGSKDLSASLAQLPGISESADKGFLIDIVKAIDEEYTEGAINISVYPMLRSIANVQLGKADFHMPASLIPGFIPEGIRVIKEKYGVTSYVLYSNKNKPLTRKMLEDAASKGGEFPYKIEGIQCSSKFPVVEFPFIDQGIQKVNSLRIDGFIFPQEDVDMIIKKMKLQNIHRELYGEFDNVIFISSANPDADKLDKILSEAIIKLRASGKLEKLYSKIHKPYDNWQPSNMGW